MALYYTISCDVSCDSFDSAVNSIVPSRSDLAEWAWPLSTMAGPPGGQGEAAGSRSPGR